MIRSAYHTVSVLIIFCLMAAVLPGLVKGQENSAAGQPQVSVRPWHVNCSDAESDTGAACQMSRAMVLEDKKTLLLRFTINLFASSPNPSFLLQLPHGIYLPDGVNLTIDDLAPRHEIVQTCDPAGCYVGLGADRAYLTALRNGTILKVSYQNIGRNTVVINFPLDDFSTAYAKMITWPAAGTVTKD